MARFLSIKTLLQDSSQTFSRFPLPLFYAFVGSLVSIYLTEMRHDENELEQTLVSLLMVCSLGLTLSFSLTLFSERKKHGRGIWLALQAAALLLLAAYFFFLRAYFVQVEFVRYALINTALHLFASFAAYTGRNNLQGFWQFNKALFLRLFFGAIYSLTIYVGIALAMLAVDELFNVNIKGENYMRVWIVVAGIFNTWFFLAGVPRDLEALNGLEEYPKGLKIFTQYVLLPLVTLYLLILYAYLGKILLAQSLPKGWVSNLVLGISVLGILALLLIWPIRNKEGNNWIRIFSRWFYGALYPLIIMLFVAIGRRIGDYGVTENRYFIVVLAVWLACIAAYFLFSKAGNIKLIPLTLCAIALLSSFGPWSAFSVSERSQFYRLAKILSENEVLVNDKIDPAHKEVPDSVAGQITSIVSYFSEMHGFEKFKPWFKEDIDSIVKSPERWGKSSKIMELMNIKEVYRYDYAHDDDGESYRSFSYYPEYSGSNIRHISGYDYELVFGASTYENVSYTRYTIGSDSLQFSLSKDSANLNVTFNGRVVAVLDMNKFIHAINDSANRQNNYNTQVPQPYMEKVLEDSTLRIKLQFNSIHGSVRKQVYKTTHAGGNCLIKVKTKFPA